MSAVLVSGFIPAMPLQNAHDEYGKKELTVPGAGYPCRTVPCLKPRRKLRSNPETQLVTRFASAPFCPASRIRHVLYYEESGKILFCPGKTAKRANPALHFFQDDNYAEEAMIKDTDDA